jgi:hypothetical protein
MSPISVERSLFQPLVTQFSMVVTAFLALGASILAVVTMIALLVTPFFPLVTTFFHFVSPIALPRRSFCDDVRSEQQKGGDENEPEQAF